LQNIVQALHAILPKSISSTTGAAPGSQYRKQSFSNNIITDITPEKHAGSAAY
jgi:hypothetical protein